MKYWIYFSVICLVTAYAVLGLVAYSLFWPVRTLEIKNFSESNPIKLTTDVVHPGDNLEYVLDYCKYTDVPNVVHRTMVDGQVITLTDTPGKLPIGCHKVVVRTAVVPPTINPGTYYLDVVVAYKINMFRTEYIHYHTEYFEVVRGEPDATTTEETILLKD